MSYATVQIFIGKKSLDELSTQQSPGSLRFYGALSMLLTAFLVYSAYESKLSFPVYEDLKFISGELSNREKEKYGINFSLSRDNDSFRYYSKGDAFNKVWQEIRTGTNATVGVDSSDTGTHTVYDLSIDGRSVRSYAEIKKAYEDDDALVNWMAPVFFIMGLFLYWTANKLENHLESSESSSLDQ